MSQTISREVYFPESPDLPLARPASAPAVARSRLHPAWWLLALVPFVLLAVLPSIPGPGVDADDFAQYLMHAKALALGHPYTHILYIHSRLNPWIGPEMALPGLPLLLAPVIRVAGLAPIPWVMLAFAMAFLALAGGYFARNNDPRLALAAVAISAMTTGVVFAATQPLTDLPMCAAMWAVAFIADRPGLLRYRDAALLTLLVVVALMLRTAAIALLPALVAAAFLRGRKGGWRLTIPVIFLAAAGAVALAFVDVHRVLLIRLSGGRLLAWMLSPANVMHQARMYGGMLLDSQLGGFSAGALGPLRFVPLALSIVGVLAWMRRSYRSFGVVFTIAYGAMLLVLPFHHERYLWPLLPVFAFGLVEGTRVVARALRAAPVVAMRVAVVAGFAVAVLGGAHTALAARPGSFADLPDGRQMMAFVRATAAREPVRVTFAKPRTIAYTLKIPAMGAFSAPEDVTYRELCAQRISHVIVTMTPPQLDAGLRKLTTTRPDAFRLEFANPTYRVYRYVRACPAGATPAAASAR